MHLTLATATLVVSSAALTLAFLYKLTTRLRKPISDSPKHASASRKPSSPTCCQPAPQTLFLITHTETAPHPDKSDARGEDAHFTTESCAGVFDGVGAFRQNGTGDSGIYAREVAARTRESLRASPSVVHALETAVANTNPVGSTTACVMDVRSGRAVGVSVGDSKAIILRDGKSVFETNTRQHSFNRPVQVGKWSSDTVFDGEFFETGVRHGDCVVLASDGLWDNVYLKRVVEIVDYQVRKAGVWDSDRRCGGERLDGGVKRLAGGIARELMVDAMVGAENELWFSPFSECAAKHGRLHNGGKLDDITIIVAFVFDGQNGDHGIDGLNS